jgi:DNA-binding NtrC family response regulator
VLSATNSDLQQAIARGQFRQDLYYRLNVVELHLTDLAQRVDDILPLASLFLQGKKPLSQAAAKVLLQYSWPGNVRELQNVCQRAALLSAGPEILPDDLGLPVLEPLSAKRALDDVERADIEQALAAAGGVVARAARSLGLSRQALYRRMEFYGIAPP